MNSSVGGVGGISQQQQQQQQRRQRQTSRNSSVDDDSQVTSAAVVVMVNQDDDTSSPSSSSVSSSSHCNPHQNSLRSSPSPPNFFYSSATATSSSSSFPSLYFHNSVNNKTLPHSSQRSCSGVSSSGLSSLHQSSSHHRQHQHNYPFIPEVLPVSMLRFAALVNENAVPPIRKMEWTVPIKCTITITKTIGTASPTSLENNEISTVEENDKTTTSIATKPETNKEKGGEKKITPDPEALISLVREEQKWLLRRQKIGDAQRELVLALCCNSSDDFPHDEGDMYDEMAGNTNQGKESQEQGGEWTILGGRAPVASMLRSWLETSTAGWISEKSPAESANAGFDDASSNRSSPSSSEREKVEKKDGLDNDADHHEGENNLDNVGSTTNDSKSEEKGDNVNDNLSPKKTTNPLPSQLTRTREEIDFLWGDIIDVGALDWWHTLQVARAAADLVSEGWCPPRNNIARGNGPQSAAVADDIVYGLLTIAQKGVLLSRADTKCSSEDKDQDAREERLAASSSAAEASSALSGLGSKGYILPTSLDFTAGVLCRLLAASDTTMSASSAPDLFPITDDLIDAAEGEQLKLEKETFLAQRESCLADTAETLWTLLADETSADTTIAAMLQMMNVNLSPSFPHNLVHHQSQQHQQEQQSPETGKDTVSTMGQTDSEITDNGHERSNSTTILCVGGIIRALGAALWGNPPSVKGVPILRIHWSTFLAMIGKVAATVHDTHVNERRQYSSSGTSLTGLISSKDDNTVGASSLTTVERKSASKAAMKSVVSRPQEHMDDNRSMLSASSTATEKKLRSKLRVASSWYQDIAPPPSTVKLQPIISYKSSSLVIVLEIAVAIRRLVDGEMVVGGGLISPHEWDALIAAIENGLVPWLDHNYMPAGKGDVDDKCLNHVSRERLSQNEFLYWRINAEVRAICAQVEAFLKHCTEQATSSCHLIVDDKCCRSLHLLLLRKVSPLMSPVNAKSLAISTIRSWMAVGYLPLPGGEWIKTASRILSEAFAVYDDPSYGYLGCGYVHSPAVRLEVIHALTHDQDEKDTPTGVPCMMSPLTLTRNVRGLHLDFINSLLLPYLKAILFPEHLGNDEGTKNQAVVFPLPPISRAEIYCTAESLDDEISLRKKAIHILGKLFRSVTGERRQRISLIETLQLVAANGSNLVKAVMSKDHFSNRRSCFTMEKLLKASYELSLEAIQQLELCLRAPFGYLPHTHESVPMIVDALCAVMEIHGCQIPANTNNMQQHRTCDTIASHLLTIACIVPLARVRMTLNDRISFLGRYAVTKIIPCSVASVLNWSDEGNVHVSDREKDSSRETTIVHSSCDCKEDICDTSLIAPFIFTHGGKQANGHLRNSSQESLLHRSQQSNEGTIFNWDSIISTMKRVLLSQSQKDKNGLFESFTSQFDPNELRSCIRMIIYTTIHDFISCGIPFKFDNHTPQFFLSSQEGSGRNEDNEEIARIKALASYSSIFGMYFQKITQGTVDAETSVTLQEEPVYSELMKACNSHIALKVMHGCRALSVLMSFLCSEFPDHKRDNILDSKERIEANGGLWPLSGIESIILRLKSLMAGACTMHSYNGRIEVNKSSQQTADVAMSSRPLDPMVPILELLFDMFTLCKNSAACIPREMRLETLLVCQQISSSVCPNDISLQGRILSLQCAAAAIGFMSQDEAISAMVKITGIRQKQINTQDVGDAEGSTNTEIPNNDGLRFSGLIFDFLRRKYVIHNHNLSRYRQETSTHMNIAKETEDIESFSVCKDDSNNPKGVGVWMCGDVLLMCRLGGTSSRHRGWIEITLRSPSCRVRHLMRLSKRISVKDPDFPSPIWDDLKVHNGTKQRAAEKSHFPIQQSNRQLVRDLSKSVVMEKASSTIRQFNEQLGFDNRFSRENDNSQTNDFSLTGQGHTTTPGTITSGTRDSSTRSGRIRSITEQDNYTKSTFWGNTTERSPERQKSGGLRRTLSAGDISLDNHGPTTKSVLDGSLQTESVFRWLNLVLGDSPDSIDSILEHIRAFGIPDHLIGLPNTSPDNANGPTLFDGAMYPLQVGPRLLRAISILDRTPTFQTHKIALLHASPHDVSERGSSTSGVLDSTSGSSGFMSFANKLGAVVSTRHLKYFSGGLDTSPYSADGEFALAWIGNEDADESSCESITAMSMVLFHAVNFMPVGTTNRKRHVGNDVVHIIYIDNDYLPGSGVEDDKIDINDGTFVSGDFGFVTIFVMPFMHIDDVRVLVRVRKGLDVKISSALMHLEANAIVPIGAVGTYVRQLAMHADLVCRSMMEDRLGLVSNWEERLLQIRGMDRYLNTNT